jgi:hypothetical protein
LKGSAFLKVRKDRAQSELSLHRERERSLAAEALVVAQAEEIATLKQQLALLQDKYDTDCADFKEQLRQGAAREEYLKGLSNESFELLTLYGIRNM